MSWHDIVEYNDGVLILKNNMRGGKKAGCEYGCKSDSIGYKVAMRDGKLYLVHRIIWEMFNGKIPEGMEIDHINGVRDDNRIENLRCVTKQENALNKRMTKRNNSGVTGVCWDSRLNKWLVQISRKGYEKHSSHHDSFDEAVSKRKLLEIEYGFHKNHGNQH